MNLSYSDEQNMLREQVLKFCESDYTFDVREKIVESNYGHNPETWKQFADLGWLAVPFSEENGGFNFGPIELAVIFEEFGKALVAEPYLANVVMSGSVLESSSNELAKQTISKIIDGTTHVSVAFSEANNGYNFHDIETSVDDGKLNGVKTVVLNASFANSFLVYAKNGDKPVIYLVDAKAAGVSVNSFSTVDGQNCGDVTFENVEVGESLIISHDNDASQAINAMLDLANLCICAEAVGGMTASYLKTVQYTKEREQFGQPISNFQVLQHKMVDMFIEAEVSKSLLFKAMLQLDGKDDEASKTISGLKAQIGKSSRQVGQAAVQLHGGMGVSDEMSIGHYLKRFTVIDALFGNRNYHLNNFSNL